MTSIRTQLPYEYYSLKFCEPKGEKEYKVENLGMYGYLFYHDVTIPYNTLSNWFLTVTCLL